jgi:hypothetical protein
LLTAGDITAINSTVAAGAGSSVNGTVQITTDVRPPPSRTRPDTSSITAAPFYPLSNSSDYITVTGYLDGDIMSPIVFANVSRGDCRFPDTTGTGLSMINLDALTMLGSEYASCCDANSQVKRLLNDGHLGHFHYPEVYVTDTTLISGIKYSALEKECTHIIWGVPFKNFTATSTTWARNYSATPSSRYTSFPCSVEGNDCEKLFTTYAANLESWRVKYDHQPMNEVIGKERARYLVPLCTRLQPECDDECVIYASKADLYFFRPRSRSANMCAHSPTPLPKMYSFDAGKFFRISAASLTLKP